MLNGNKLSVPKLRLFCLQQCLVSDFPVFISTHKFSHSHSSYFFSCPVGDGGSEQLRGCLAARWDQPPQPSISLQFFTLAFQYLILSAITKSQSSVDFSTAILLTPFRNSIIPPIKMHFLANYFLLFPSILNIIKIAY